MDEPPSDSSTSTLNHKLSTFFPPDECHQMDILTPDFVPYSRLPAGADPTNSGLWEFVIRYSGATVADSHGVPCI
jgi:hypothetical protein